MGARQSKRSVDITTTPKKGDGEVISEGEGKLEKIGDADIKVTTNGSLPHTDLEVADKDENAKDSVAEKDTDEKVQENGVSESEEVKTPDTENLAEKLSETAATEDKTPESVSESKIEETAESKKQKEKSKKKKWSFRSISFSKKDKSKPSKDNEKNGDVKEVVEENAEENATSPSIESPKSEDLKVPEAVTNGDAPADDTAKPTDTPTTVEEPEKPVEEPKAEEPKAAEIEEPKVPEPIVEKSVESAPSPAKEQEEPKSVEPPTPVEETKEVRSEEIPPPLPSSNPPSPVTVFAESTKADSLTADQVPINLPQSVPVVETIPEPSVVQSVLESQPLAASSPVINTVCENPAVLETKIESVSQQNDEKSSLETVSVPEPLQKDNTETFRNDQASEQISDSSKTEISKTPECATDPSAPIEVSPDAPKSSEVDLIPSQETETSPKPDKIPEEVTKSEVIENLPENATESKQETVISPESVKTVSESQKENEPEPVSEPTETNQLVTEKNESTLHVEAAEITKEEKLPDVSMQATTIEEVSKETLEAPESLTESPGVSVNIGGAQLATENSEKPEEETIEDAVKSIKSSDVSNEVIETSEVLLDPSKPKETVVVEEKPEILQETPKDFKETVTESAEQSSDLPEESAKLPEPSQSPETCLTEPPVEPSLPSPLSSTDVVQESSTPVPENIPGPVVTSPESQSPTIEQLPESVVNPADSLPDISTESLPSLPEPLSENLAEPMSLPPVDSVPEPIATDCPVSEISHPSDSTVLTNGNANGLPSPTDEVSALPLKEGPLKQVPTETSNEVRQEEGDQKIIAVDAPAVEE